MSSRIAVLDRVRKFDGNGAQLLAITVADGHWSAGAGPRGIAVDSDDNVYVTLLEGHKVVVFGTEEPPPVVSTIASSPWSIALVAVGALGLLLWLGRATLPPLKREGR
jgi:DNA-binding beta-propeller fold protein YncE